MIHWRSLVSSSWCKRVLNVLHSKNCRPRAKSSRRRSSMLPKNTICWLLPTPPICGRLYSFLMLGSQPWLINSSIKHILRRWSPATRRLMPSWCLLSPPSVRWWAWELQRHGRVVPKPTSFWLTRRDIFCAIVWESLLKDAASSMHTVV